MRIDFHYYATYVAARLAGYELDEAQSIAHAAQYVDESSWKMLRKGNKNYIKDFTPTPTVHEMLSEITEFNSSKWSDANLLETYRVWMAFHFLPGNYGRPDTVSYSGPTSAKSHTIGWGVNQTVWLYNQEAKHYFKLLCLDNSLLVDEMINDLVINHANNLHMIGLRMHVLADTWAHKHFAGMPAWYMNDVYSVKDANYLDKSIIRSMPVISEIDLAGRTIPYVWLPDPVPYLKNFHNTGEFSPDAPSYNSYLYHGHGRSGHLPDYAYLKYTYRPRWSNKPIVRDNRDGFLKAFKQLLKAMQCVRQKVPFETNNYAQLDPQTEDTIIKVLYTRYPDQSDTWTSLIPRIHLDGKPMEIPEPYDKNAWLEEYKRASGPEGFGKETHYYKFNQAAVLHLNLVRQHLEKNDLFILSGDEGDNTLEGYLRTDKGEYIGDTSLGETKAHHFATVSDKAVLHKLIKTNAGPLYSGDIIQIKTTDATPGHKAYLGAWSEKKELYYYKQDYRVLRQRWEIVKADLSKDNIIRHGDRFYVKNLHITSNPNGLFFIPRKPYMSLYTHWLTRKKYLTTQSQPFVWTYEEAR